MRPRLVLFLSLLATIGCLSGARADDGSFYLHTSPSLIPLGGGRTGTNVLTGEPPTASEPRWKSATIEPGHMVMVGEFVSLPIPGPGQVTPTPASATLHLVTNGSGTIGQSMSTCADIKIDVFHDSPGHRTLLSDEDFFDQTIPADRTIGVDVDPAPLTFNLVIDPTRKDLATGDGISIEVRVRNRCTQTRRVRLLYDAVGTPSLLQLGDNCPGLANPDQLDTDGDGIGDACEGGPPQGPPDSDGDGIGDSFDKCPGTPAGELVDRDGCSCSQLPCNDANVCTEDGCIPGSGCTHDTDCACPSLDCDDGDPCTIDSCVAGSGCQHVVQSGVIDNVVCQIETLRNTIVGASPDEIAHKLVRKRSRLMKSLRRSVRLAGFLRTKNLQFGSIAPKDRKLRRLRKVFGRSVKAIDRGGTRGQIVPALHDRCTPIVGRVLSGLASIGTP